MTQAARVVSVIMNEASGSQGGATARDRIQRAFADLGVDVRILPLPKPPKPHIVERLVADAAGTLAVAGGDGTINTVASACHKVKRPLGILPCGTFNYVARNLGIPVEIEGAARALVESTPRAVGAGQINGRLFLNNAGFGLYSHVIEQRELDKRRFGRHRVVALYSGLRALAHRFPIYDIALKADGRETALRTTTLFFGVNALQLRNYNVSAAECVEHGELAVLSLRFKSRLDIAAAAWAALCGTTESADSVAATCASEVQVKTRRKLLKVAIDGEIIHLRPPLRVEYVQDALQVFAPEPQPSATDSEAQTESEAAPPQPAPARGTTTPASTAHVPAAER